LTIGQQSLQDTADGKLAKQVREKKSAPPKPEVSDPSDLVSLEQPNPSAISDTDVRIEPVDTDVRIEPVDTHSAIPSARENRNHAVLAHYIRSMGNSSSDGTQKRLLVNLLKNPLSEKEKGEALKSYVTAAKESRHNFNILQLNLNRMEVDGLDANEYSWTTTHTSTNEDGTTNVTTKTHRRGCMGAGLHVQRSTIRNSSFNYGDLPNSDFSNSTLSGLSFKNTNLSGSSFRNCKIDNVDFTGANIQYADFTGAEFGQGIKAQGANVYRTIGFPEARGTIRSRRAARSHVNQWQESRFKEICALALLVGCGGLVCAAILTTIIILAIYFSNPGE